MKKNATVKLIEALEPRIAPAVIFTVETSTNKLVSFDSATPGTLLADVTITGLQAGEVIAAIDFRPATGELYGLGLVGNGTLAGRLYKINPSTAQATLVGAGPFSTTLADTNEYGFDFNPAVDRIRVVNLLDANFRLNPDTGAIAATDTNISDGAATDEQVVGVAYDRNFGSNLTTLYGYDYKTDNLVTVGGLNGTPSPNSGLLTTVARAKLGGVNFTSSNPLIGFDIGGDIGGPDIGWLAMDKQAQPGAHLYTIDLATAALTDLGAIGTSNRVFGGLAVKFDAPAPVISTDGKTATWRDLDGDNVTLKITKGTLTAANFRMLQGANETSALSKLTLTDAAFAGTNITVTAKPGADGGDGQVNIGGINATGVHLGAVSIAGDIQKLSANGSAGNLALKSLTAGSFARFGTNLLLSGESHASEIKNGGIGKITIAGDFSGYLDLGPGKNGTFTVGGDVLGGERPASGSMGTNSSGGVSFSKITIKGNVIGGEGAGSGVIEAQSKTIFIGGSVIGGANSNAGSVSTSSGSTVTAGSNIIIGGSVIGGSGISSGSVTVYMTSSVKIGGNLEGGTGFNSGRIIATNDGTFLKSLTIGGSVIQEGSSGGIYVARAGAIAVKGSVIGNADFAVPIQARGVSNPATAAESVAIGSITIGGSIEHAHIAAGFLGSGTTADAAIGKVKIGKSMIASSITAGTDIVNGVAGDADDKFFGGNNGNTAIIARIASITIGGQLLGTAGGAPDSFGIIAEQIGALSVNKLKIPLTAAKDDFTLGFTSDVRVREL